MATAITTTYQTCTGHSMLELKVKQITDDFDKRAKYAQIKRDGYRMYITRDDSGIVKCWTRNSKDWTSMVRELPQAQVLWNRLSVPCILHAELWKERTPATSVITAVKAVDPGVKLSVFGVERAVHPEAPIDEVALWCTKHGLDFIPCYVRGDRYPGCAGKFTSLSDLPKPHGDIEGYVFKDGNMLNWQKWTEVHTLSLVVTGVVAGNGRLAGTVGSVILSDRRGVEVCRAGSGLDDVERARLQQSSPIGRICDVSFKGISENFVLRHPRFVRWREDLSLADVDDVKAVALKRPMEVKAELQKQLSEFIQ